MQVLHVCSEMFPLLKTGGLADVIGALPAAQIAEGIDTRVLLPAFPDIRRGINRCAGGDAQRHLCRPHHAAVWPF
ncbi:Glycogen synthase [Raoultella terrigena]|uniref:starch synthase n=1 Tax=Raoultella terrigena TaxID=577 RepID=A0A3P8IPK2_RAOTE|nr:Glycogen synthase [Raoultella terrigena]